MSHEQAPTPRPSSDPMDQLLSEAFDQALSALDSVDLVEITMRRIVVEQRRRTIVFTLIGILAAVVCVLTSLPLLDLVQTFFSELGGRSGLAGAAEGIAGWQSNLPVLTLTLAIAAGGVWLLLEEAF